MFPIGVLYISLLTIVCADDGESCSNPSTPTRISTGLNVDFWNLPVLSQAPWEDSSFFQGGYKAFGYYGSVTGVTKAQFDIYIDRPNAEPVKDKIYDLPITVTNYTMVASGFFYAAEDGEYTFTFQFDDGGIFRFGSSANHCCNNATYSVTEGVSINRMFQQSGKVPEASSTKTFPLKAGSYYPIEIIGFNWRRSTRLVIEFKSPSMSTAEDIGSHVYQVEYPSVVCWTTTTSYCDKSTTSTTTATGSSFNTVIVEVPKSATTTTITTHCTGDTTTSYTVTGGPGECDTIVFEIPMQQTAIFEYEFSSSMTGDEEDSTSSEGITFGGSEASESASPPEPFTETSTVSCSNDSNKPEESNTSDSSETDISSHTDEVGNNKGCKECDGSNTTECPDGSKESNGSDTTGCPDGSKESNGSDTTDCPDGSKESNGSDTTGCPDGSKESNGSDTSNGSDSPYGPKTCDKSLNPLSTAIKPHSTTTSKCSQTSTQHSPTSSVKSMPSISYTAGKGHKQTIAVFMALVPFLPVVF